MYFTGNAAGDYDAVPYDAPPRALTDIEGLVELSGARGGRTDIRDVLDLGCGFGRQLLQASASTTGRLIGVDVSPVTCEGARQVLAGLGDRVEIIQADVASLDAGRIGPVDAIYCVGTLFTLQPADRDHLLRIVRETLRPGGLALFTYHAGTIGGISASIGRYIRSLQIGGETVVDALARARAHLRALTAFQTSGAPHIQAVVDQVNAIASMPDVALVHEGLGHGIQLVNTAELGASLAPAGIEFQGYLGFDPANFDCTPAERIYRAESLDILEGGYRFALFTRTATV